MCARKIAFLGINEGCVQGTKFKREEVKVAGKGINNTIA